MKLFDRIVSYVSKKETETEVDIVKDIYSHGKSLCLGLYDLSYELYVNTFIYVWSVFYERVFDNIKENIDVVSNACYKHGYDFVCLPQIIGIDNVRKYA